VKFKSRMKMTLNGGYYGERELCNELEKMGENLEEEWDGGGVVIN